MKVLVAAVLLLVLGGCCSCEPRAGESCCHVKRRCVVNYHDFPTYDEEDLRYCPADRHHLDINEMP